MKLNSWYWKAAASVVVIGAVGWAGLASMARPAQAVAAPAPPPVEPVPDQPCATAGPTQFAVENYLAEHPGYGPAIPDGEQSAQDCAAIRRLQERFDVASPSGYATPLTGRIVARLNSARLAECRDAEICVDLTTQTMWLRRGSTIVLGPTIVRTGRAGDATPTGHFRITEKRAHAVSTVTGTPMYDWQHMRDGYGFHQAWSYLHDPSVPGSLGCVNLTARDAEDLFALTTIGSTVHIFGHKPGT
jgi:lipoprotein-anchoring transpeptidase ErfK/SrfK